MCRFVVSWIVLAFLNVACWGQSTLSLAVQPHGIPPKGAAAASQPASTYYGIQYNGGPVMNQVNGTNFYFIWYGNWSNNTEPVILTDFVNHIGGTAHFNINTSYYDFNKFGNGEKDPVVNRVNFRGSVTDNYSLGNNLSDNNVAAVVGETLSSKEFPVDRNGLYVVLTSKDVTQGSFCNQFCGWHSYGFAGDVPIKVAFVGDSDQCPSFCQHQNPSPNNNPAADDAATYIAHELSETVTDPLLNAWFNPGLIENGDLCYLDFGSTKVLPNGSSYNITFAGRPYFIQELWVNARGGYCALAFDE